MSNAPRIPNRLGPDGSFGVLSSSNGFAGVAVVPGRKTVVVNSNACQRATPGTCARRIRGGLRLPRLMNISGVLRFRVGKNSIVMLGFFIGASGSKGRVGS